MNCLDSSFIIDFLDPDTDHHEGAVEWDTARPEGQDRQRVDISRAADRFGWQPETNLAAGLRRTVEWYEREQSR